MLMRSRAPTLLLSVSGHHLTVLGAVFPFKVTVQVLGSISLIPGAKRSDAVLHLQVTRFLVALRLTLLKLREYYNSFSQGELPDFTPPLFAFGNQPTSPPHPRFFPYPVFYETEGTKHCFRYLDFLEKSPACMTFLAETIGPSPRKIVVKYVDRYGTEIHNFLASKGKAPALHFCGALPGSAPDIDKPLLKYDATRFVKLGQPSLMMAVMDYVESVELKDSEIAEAQKQVHEVLQLLHHKGFVFGDLRRPNVLFAQEDGKKVLKLIDFNWSGCYRSKNSQCLLPIVSTSTSTSSSLDEEYARYPENLNIEGITWAPDVLPGGQILPCHDMFMLERLFTRPSELGLKALTVP
ncbi:MAG TPA: hypothetical protein VGN34_04510, partial [Ktedonobacteraceae bacterium]